MTRRFSFWTVATTLALFLFAAAAPSPLYAVYAARWRFSAITLTEVFAVYAVALLVALLLTGPLSDFAGRRPVILGAIAIEVASMLTFVAASDVTWLFVARITASEEGGARHVPERADTTSRGREWDRLCLPRRRRE